MKIITLIGLTLLVAVSTGVSIYYLKLDALSSYGSILAAAAGLIAVIWFTGSLWYQAQQLNEQRAQFLKEFSNIREDSRRNALMLSREILNSTEEKALSQNLNIQRLSELPMLYLNFVELKDIMESEDPETVQAAIENWMKKEAPALTLMKGLKSAAEVYFLAVGKEDIDFTKEPAEFVSVYGPLLWPLPFFDAFQAPAILLSQFMVKLEPGRQAAFVASSGVMAALAPDIKLVKMEVIKENIAAHLEKGYPLPKIMEKFLNDEAPR